MQLLLLFFCTHFYYFFAFILSVFTLIVYNKEILERQETNKYGRGAERHLPETDESIAGERR